MNFKGEVFGEADNKNFQDQLNVLTTNLGTTNTNVTATNVIVASNTDTLRRVNDAAITTGPPGSNTSSIFPTNVTPSNIVGTLNIPFADCRVGMAFRIKVFTGIQVNPFNVLRLYLAQDTSGNFPWTPLEYVTFAQNAQEDNFMWEFNVAFRGINPVNAWGTRQQNLALHYVDSSVNPITTNGVIFYLIAQWAPPDTGIKNFRVINMTVERIAGFV